jgi:hypothetical protein
MIFSRAETHPAARPDNVSSRRWDRSERDRANEPNKTPIVACVTRRQPVSLSVFRMCCYQLRDIRKFDGV